MRVSVIKAAIFLSMSAAIAACANTSAPQQSVTTSANMEQSPTYADTMRYVRPGVDLKKYTAFIVDPVDIYRGSDAQFGNTTPADRAEIARFMQQEFARVIGQRYAIVSAPAPNAVRIHMTLIGLEATQPALATVTHLLPAGIVLNAAKGASGGTGSFMGSVSFEADFYDSQTNQLVAAVVTRQSANAMDLLATTSGLASAKAGVTEGAQKLLSAIDKIQAGG